MLCKYTTCTFVSYMKKTQFCFCDALAKKITFFRTFPSASVMHDCIWVVDLNAIYSFLSMRLSSVEEKKAKGRRREENHLLTCIPTEMHWRSWTFLLKSGFIDFRFVLLWRTSKYTWISLWIAKGNSVPISDRCRINTRMNETRKSTNVDFILI